MIVPVFLEVLELRKFKIPVVIPATLVLFGSLMLRFLIAFAGQESRWLY
jgi:formate-dependent nitrite reductase membrane component NrfD